MIYGKIDELIKENTKKILPRKHYTDAVWNLAQRYKGICMENLYTWRTMDEDIMKEARIIKDKSCA